MNISVSAAALALLILSSCAPFPQPTADRHYRAGETVKYLDGHTEKVQPPRPPGPPSRTDLVYAKGFGRNIVATGRGTAINASGEPTCLEPGEPVEYVSLDPDTDQVLVRRMKYNVYATVPRVELRLE